MKLFWLYLLLMIALPGGSVWAAPDSHAASKPPLNWETVQELLANHNRTLAISQENSQIAAAGVAITQAATGPRITAGLGASWASGSDSLPGIGITQFDSGLSSSGANTSISMSQTLWDWGKNGSAITAAQANQRADAQTAVLTASDVLTLTRKQFYQLWYSESLVKLNQSILITRKDQYELLRYRYASGLEHEGSLLTAKTNLAQSETLLAQSIRQVMLTRATLIQLVNADLSSYGETTLDIRNLPLEIPSENIYSNLDHHPKVQRANATLIAAQADLAAHQTAAYPNLTADFSAAKSASFTPTTTHRDSLSASTGISIPIWDGGAIGSELAQSQHRVTVAELSLEDTRSQVALSLRNALDNWQTAVENLNIQSQYWKASNTRSDIATVQYKSGRISFNEWIVIEDNLIQSQTALLRAQLAVWNAAADWKNAKGESLELK